MNSDFEAIFELEPKKDISADFELCQREELEVMFELNVVPDITHLATKVEVEEHVSRITDNLTAEVERATERENEIEKQVDELSKNVLYFKEIDDGE
jgi:hypothetical protein